MHPRWLLLGLAFSLFAGWCACSGSGAGATAAAPVGVPAMSLSQWGITWQFAAERPIGQFVNGDPWVVGPVEIVSITPRTTDLQGRIVHGSIVNPMPDGDHGYDSTLYGDYATRHFRPERNVAAGVDGQHPLHLPPGTSLISTESQLTPATNGSVSQLRTAAVLTVLAAVPPADAFRPPYVGNDKSIRFRERDLDYARLRRVPAVGDPPSFAATAAQMQRVWLDHCPGWYSRFLHPVDNMPDYSRDFTSVIGSAALLLQLDVPNTQKRELLIRLVQFGLDCFGNVQNGCAWPGTGGQCSGRKFPILFAGAVLHDDAMLRIGLTHPSVLFAPGDARNTAWFGEDSQTFYVQETAPNTFNWGIGGYTAAERGLPEWGNAHILNTNLDNAAWEADSYRRCCTVNGWIGEVLAARLMGLAAAWNHPALFDYTDRYLSIEPSPRWTRAWEPWQDEMWRALRASN